MQSEMLDMFIMSSCTTYPNIFQNEVLYKATPLVYAIYFPTIDFLQILFDNTTISTSYYVNCFFAKTKSFNIFKRPLKNIGLPPNDSVICLFKKIYFCVTTSTNKHSGNS